MLALPVNLFITYGKSMLNEWKNSCWSNSTLYCLNPFNFFANSNKKNYAICCASHGIILLKNTNSSTQKRHHYPHLTCSIYLQWYSSAIPLQNYILKTYREKLTGPSSKKLQNINTTLIRSKLDYYSIVHSSASVSLL